MIQTDYIAQIYSNLPAAAQQEVFDFMLFLQQRYGDKTVLLEKAVGEKSHRSIRDNPAFGMWADVRGDSRELLNQIRRAQWISS